MQNNRIMKHASRWAGPWPLALMCSIIVTIGILPIFFDGLSWGLGTGVYDFDFISQQIPFIIETKRMLASGTPWWSWNTFTGDNFIGAYSFYTLTSPFVWIICLFPLKMILWGILFALYLKEICTALAAYAYLRFMGFDKQLSTLGGLLYAFSSFFICNLFYFHFAEPVMMFPLLLLGVENFVRGGRMRGTWLALAVFGTVFINFYFAFASLLIALAYGLLRAHSLRTLSFALLGKAVLFVLLGVALAATMLLPTLAEMLNTPRMDEKPDILVGYESIHSTLSLLAGKGLAILMPEVAETRPTAFFSKGFWSTHAFISVFSFLPCIIYVFKRRDWLMILIVTLTIAFFSPLNGIFTLFTNPQYTRWLYAFTFFEIMAALYVLKNGWLKLKWAAIYSAGIVFFLVAVFIAAKYIFLKPDEDPNINIREYMEGSLCIFNCVCLIIVACKPSYPRIALCVSICSALVLASFTQLLFNMHNNKQLPMDEHYFNKYILHPELDYSDAPFSSRSDFMCESFNSPAFYNRPGVMGFHSVYNPTMTEWRAAIEEDPKTVTFTVTAGRASTGTLMSVRDIYDYRTPALLYKQQAAPYREGLTLREKHRDYDLYSFDYYIPIGMAFDTYLKRSQVKALLRRIPNADICRIMLNHLVVRDEDLPELEPYLREGSFGNILPLDSIAAKRRQATAKSFTGDTRGFTATTDLPEDRVMFFSVPADPGFTASIDGKPVKLYNVNLGMSAVIVPKGPHTIRFDFFPPGLKAGAAISLAALVLLILAALTERRRPKTE